MAGNSAVTEPAVQALIAAINAGDRAAFFAALTPGATMSDDGTDRDLAGWADREIFTVHGHLDVLSARDGGRSLTAASRPARHDQVHPPRMGRRAVRPAGLAKVRNASTARSTIAGAEGLACGVSFGSGCSRWPSWSSVSWWPGAGARPRM